MKKNLKFVGIIATALLTVAPVAGIFNQPTSAAVKSQKLNSANVVKHFIGSHSVLLDEAGNPVPYTTGSVIAHVENENGYRTNGALINGHQYQILGNYSFSGFEAQPEVRTIHLIGANGNKGNIIGVFTIPAKATSVKGKVDFNFTVNNGELGNSSLGATRLLAGVNNQTSVKNKKAKKHAKRFVKKHAKKRSSKKSRK